MILNRSLSTKRRKGDSARKREEVAELSEQEIGTMLESFLAEDYDSGSEWEWSEGDDSEESDSGEEDPAADASPRFCTSSPIPSRSPLQGLKKLPEEHTPRDFFNLFTTDGFYDHVVKETNIQAEEIFFRNPSPRARITLWKELTVREFHIFLGLLLHILLQLDETGSMIIGGKGSSST
ncbi:hypothetical protein J437_LFUL005647 [Ladona fulva]|uniref:PiggyBac transposable element-derived protein domain-containing protein n=1 Tax=Ladona fulva TaxID=123851 RepID=A0A8K0K6H7_LADFU|nr:hypothetical protein J437_LFUL005647 [Ladona fulva]